jgi:hypothetical protein
MSQFRAAPRQGHLDRLKRMCGYLRTYSSAAISVRVSDPDFKDLPDQDFNWCETVYGKVEELLPTDSPEPLGNSVTAVTYTDANLQHELLTGRAVTGALHLFN